MPNAQVIQLHPSPTTQASSPALTSLLKPISPSGTFNPRSDLKSNGIPKPKEVCPLKSFHDYSLLHAHLSRQNTRDASLLTIGIATGLRISDLLSLKIGHLIQSDESGKPIFRDILDIHEQKTGKKTKGIDGCVYITEAVRDAATRLINENASKGKFLSLDDWLFYSKQPQRNEMTTDDDGNEIPNPLYGQHVFTKSGAHRILKEAQRELNIRYNISTHTMRKTFACLYYQCSARTRSMEGKAALEDVQMALRHSSPRATMRYLGITKERDRMIREEISDFLLGKSDIEEIKID
jgi:integrase